MESREARHCSSAAAGAAGASRLASARAATPVRLVRLGRFELGRVVRRFLRNGDVMRMALPHTGRRDLYKSRLRAQLLNGSGARVSHAGPEAANHLIQERT